MFDVLTAAHDDEARLAAVRRRDAAADGAFLYSVATAGVYCHPSCAARPALRRNIAFHANRDAAERAGFRPCKRCRPDLPPRAERKAADAMLGMTASRQRAGGPGETIRHAVGRCSLGRVLVAATGRGVCAILLGDDAAALQADLRARFPRAVLDDAGPDAEWLAAVVAFVDHPGRDAPALPLDIRGTVFQRRVWKVLRAIPPGETLSYAAVAARLGQPAAVRAVAGACAANALAVVVPCHRVVASTGALSGYRWGIERKRALLARERA